MNQFELNPQKDILAFAIKQLTANWSEEEIISFSKSCFNQVCQSRYNQFKKPPINNILVIEQ